MQTLLSQRRKHQHASGRSGQGLVEFALILPILLFAILGIIDFGRVLTTYAIVSNAVRDTLRQAEILGYAGEDPTATPRYRDCERMRDIIKQTYFAPITNDDIVVRYLNHMSLDVNGDPVEIGRCDMAAATPPSFSGDLENGNILEVSVQSDINFVTPMISSITPSMPVRFSGQRTVVIEITLHGNPDASSTDRDTDYDGLRDLWEEQYFGTSPYGVDNIMAEELLQTGTDDPDNDGCNNGCEQTRGSNPTVWDTDGDGLNDGQEAYTYNTDPTKADTDSDGLSDYDEVMGTFGEVTNPRDGDSDNDGLNDKEELVTNPIHTDPNLADTDGDGLNDYDEVKATYGHVTDPTTAFSDADGLTDAQEVLSYGTDPNLADTDGDGLNDDVELNGWTVVVGGTNVHYATDPRAGHGDDDNDGLSDGQEKTGWTSSVNGVSTHFQPNPANPDQDGDGLNDAAEKAAGTDPYSTDTDGDGLTDSEEVANGAQDPLQSDSADVDGDSLPDAWESIYFGVNFADPQYNGSGDPDSDGCSNLCEFQNGLLPTTADTDNDGLNDGYEVNTSAHRTNPKNADTDNDGLSDGAEVNTHNTYPDDADTDDDGLDDGLEINGFNSTVVINNNVTAQTFTSDPLAANSDGDSLSDNDEYARGTNPKSADTDNDGLNDDVETSNSNGYITNPRDDDSDSDGLSDGYEMNGYTAADQTCKSNPLVVDTDGDNTEDKVELDSGRNPCVKETPSLRVEDVTINEGAGTGTVTVTLNTPIGTTVSVNYTTANDVAISGQDYTAKSGTLVFSPVTPAPTAQTATFTVDITDDIADEGDERFFVNLSNPIGATISRAQGNVTIQDNDQAPTITLNDANTYENAGAMTFTITLSRASGKTVTVDWATANGSASDPGDFTAASGTAIFAPGITSQTVDIALVNDGVVESNENFNLNLSNPTNATIIRFQGIATIQDEDGYYQVSIAAGDPGGTAEDAPLGVPFVVSLDRKNVGPGDVTVSAQTIDGTASSTGTFIDFTGFSNEPVIIPANEQSVTIYVTVTDDDRYDSANQETLTVQIATPSSNAILGSPTSAVGMINDNEPLPTLTINDVAQRIDNQNAKFSSFTVSASHPSESVMSFSYIATPGRSPSGSLPSGAGYAVQNTHYVLSPTGTMSISAGFTTRSINLRIEPEGGNPPERYFFITLQTPTNVQLSADPYGDGRICDKHGC